MAQCAVQPPALALHYGRLCEVTGPKNNAHRQKKNPIKNPTLNTQPGNSEQVFSTGQQPAWALNTTQQGQNESG